VAGFFYNLGRKVGPKVRKAQWMWQSLAGSEADAIAIERRVGLDLAHELTSQVDVDLDEGTRRFVRDIGDRLARHVANQKRRFDFEVLATGEPNAFALPGGFIYITRSLIELCERDGDEVAFVLAHEMGHVIRGHAINRIVTDSAIATASRVMPVRGALGAWLKKVGVEFLVSAYSQDLETEADALGSRLAEAAGCDTDAPLRLLSRLAALREHPGEHDLSSYFATHPAPEVRMRNVRKALRKP